MTTDDGRLAVGDRATHEQSPQAVSAVPVGIPSAWTPRTVRIWQSWECGRWLAFKTNFYGPWLLSDDGGKTVIFTDGYLQEVMAQAQAIEARRAATGTGAVHESAVHEVDASNE